jgi:hypothetical protein
MKRLKALTPEMYLKMILKNHWLLKKNVNRLAESDLVRLLQVDDSYFEV